MQLRTLPILHTEDQNFEAEAGPQTDDDGFESTKAKLILLEDENAKLKKLVERVHDESIRVCVVAPTVNVHFNEQNLKFHSR